MTRNSTVWCRLAVVSGICLASLSTSHADLVAHWPLDEGSGGEFGNAVDSAVNGFLLDDTVNIEWVDVVPNDDGSGPHQGSAVEFSGENSWIQTDFPGIGGANPRTVAFWVKTTATNTHGIVGWGATADGEKWHIRVNNNAGNGVLGAIRTEPQGGQNVATTPINDDEWHHVASVFPDGATTISELLHYVDGALDPRSGGGDREINTNIGEDASPVLIGARLQGAALNFFPGIVADVRIYDEALGEAELSAIFRDAPPAEVPGLSAIGLIALAGILLAGAVWILQRRLAVNRMAM